MKESGDQIQSTLGLSIGNRDRLGEPNPKGSRAVETQDTVQDTKLKTNGCFGKTLARNPSVLRQDNYEGMDGSINHLTALSNHKKCKESPKS